MKFPARKFSVSTVKFTHGWLRPKKNPNILKLKTKLIELIEDETIIMQLKFYVSGSAAVIELSLEDFALKYDPINNSELRSELLIDKENWEFLKEYNSVAWLRPALQGFINLNT